MGVKKGGGDIGFSPTLSVLDDLCLGMESRLVVVSSLSIRLICIFNGFSYLIFPCGTIVT